jgi:tRNA-uridine 2-sulfurtransferase
MAKVVVGMSGGVDSSVTAYLLKKQGYDVEGVSFLMRDASGGTSCRPCCSLDSMESAARNARALGIPHSTIDVRDAFRTKVIGPFIDAYTKGLTPNPCVLCNRFIKFPYLIAKADEQGAEFIATGHYARVEAETITTHPLPRSAPPLEKGGKGGFERHANYFILKKGIDPKKDQAYFLYALRQEELKRLLLPLGFYKKEEVRQLAQQLKLPAADSSESQEICFIEDNNYLAFIEKHASAAGKPGPIVDMNGKEIGTHKGIYGYTIGQRKGMGIASPEPLYVADIDVPLNTLYVGTRDAAMKKEFAVGDLNWINSLVPSFGSSDEAGLAFRASVKVRSTMKEEPATLFLEANPLSPHFTKGGMGGLSIDVVRVLFDTPQWAPAPGQSAVFYDGETVIGGGVIKKQV